MIELDLGADARRVVDEVKSNIDAITTFPFQTEKPIIRELANRAQVVNIAVSSLDLPGRVGAGRNGGEHAADPRAGVPWGGVRGSGAVDASGRGTGCGSATWRP